MSHRKMSFGQGWLEGKSLTRVLMRIASALVRSFLPSPPDALNKKSSTSILPIDNSSKKPKAN